MKKKVWIIGGVLAIITLTAVMYLNGGQQVEVLQASRADLTTWVEETAYVQARDEVTIQASQNGKIIRVAVDTGQKVAAGQELLVMENPDIKYQQDAAAVQMDQLNVQLASGKIALDQAKINLEENEKNLQRSEQLFQAGALSQAEYEAIVRENKLLQKTVDLQDQALQSMQAQLGKQSTIYRDLGAKNQELVIKSPAAGTVLDLPVKKEQSVMPGTDLVQIGTEGALELKTELLSDDLANIKIGQRAEISGPILGDALLQGKVIKIYPRAYEKVSALGVIQRRVPVMISLPANEQLKPGYEVQVKIETQRRPDVLILPRTAIRINDKNQNEVLAVDNGKIKHITVRTGLKNPESIEILSGIKAGQQVVLDASTDIKEGTRVKI